MPSVVTRAGTHSGVKPSASVPPKMNKANPNARRSPLRSPASAKPLGWKAATPSPPSITPGTSQPKLGATPTSGANTAAKPRPTKINQRPRR